MQKLLGPSLLILAITISSCSGGSSSNDDGDSTSNWDTMVWDQDDWE